MGAPRQRKPTATVKSAESTLYSRYLSTRLVKHPNWLKEPDAIRLNRRVSEDRPSPSSVKRPSSPRRPHSRWSAPSAKSEDAHPFAVADPSCSERKRNPQDNSISDFKLLNYIRSENVLNHCCLRYFCTENIFPLK